MTRILIVEDDVDISALLARGLEAEGFQVGTASCVSDALQAARDPAPGAVLLDINLPDGSGHDVCRSLREGGYPGRSCSFRPATRSATAPRDWRSAPTTTSSSPSCSTSWWRRLRTHLMRREQAEAPRSRVNAAS